MFMLLFSTYIFYVSSPYITPTSGSFVFVAEDRYWSSETCFAHLNVLTPESANWHTTSQLCEYLMNFYEFLPQKLSCEDPLIKVIKL